MPGLFLLLLREHILFRLVFADQSWEGRAHFYAAAANSMRQILVNWAHGKQATKRGGDRQRVDMDDLTLVDQRLPT